MQHLQDELGRIEAAVDDNAGRLGALGSTDLDDCSREQGVHTVQLVLNGVNHRLPFELRSLRLLKFTNFTRNFQFRVEFEIF